MPRRKYSIAEQINKSRIIVTNALNDPQISAALAQYGYTEERLMAGKNLYEQTLAFHEQKQVRHSSGVGVTRERDSAQQRAHDYYMSLVKIARVALKNQPVMLASLQLQGPRKSTLAGWLLQARQFYNVALADADIGSQLAAFGITDVRLREGLGLLETLEAVDTTQKRERGTAQMTTRQRDEALKALNAWSKDVVAVARVALAHDPQQLEKLGIIAA